MKGITVSFPLIMKKKSQYLKSVRYDVSKAVQRHTKLESNLIEFLTFSLFLNHLEYVSQDFLEGVYLFQSFQTQILTILN